MSDIVESFEHNGKKIVIRYDDSPDSPREWDNLGVMVCWHRRYNLGDEHGYASPDDFSEEWLAPHIGRKGAVILPLYLYDHSGITMRATDFGDRWDSGQVGWIYADYDTIRKEYSCKRVTKAIRETVAACLRSEVSTYDDYLTGQVFGYEVRASEHDEDGEEIEGELLDSCWGFYGLDYCREEAKSAA